MIVQYLKPILDMLDEGLRLYRRGFVGFVLVTAIWFVPVVIGVSLSIAAVRYWGSWVVFLILLGWGLGIIPLSMYLVGGLSRALLMIQQGYNVQVWSALAIHPLWATGMGCYGLILYIIASIVSSIVSILCLCPLYTVIVGTIGSIGFFAETAGHLGTGLAILSGIMLTMVLVLYYGLSLVLGGATFSTLVYGLQPFVQDSLSFGNAIQRSIDLILYRVGYNLLAFMFASMIFGAMAIAVTVAVGVLIPLPLVLALGSESLVTQGVSASAWLLGVALVLPPLPIWMALLYQHNVRRWQGADLARRITALTPHPSLDM